MGSLIYLLSTIVDLCFVVHKLAKISLICGRLYCCGSLNLLRYIRNNKNLGLEYYSKIEDAPLSDQFRQDGINTENKFMVL